MGLYENNNGTLDLLAGGTLYADAPIGSIYPFGGTTAPQGFMICDGTAISRTTYAALFAVIGTNFGTGDGSTTFNIPDMREVVPVGAGTSTRSGIATHDTYSVGGFKDDQVQDHSHNYSSVPQDSTSDLAIQPLSGGYKYGNKHSYATTTNATGRHGSTTHGKQLGVNYIIKAEQIALPVDFLDVYSTSEVKTNKVWINGKPIYRSVIDVGTLPNSSLKQIQHNLTYTHITDYYLIAESTSVDNQTVKISGYAPGNESVYIAPTVIQLTTINNLSAYYGYVIVEYTKD